MRASPRTRLYAACLVLAAGGIAVADEPPAEGIGVYGRFDHDLALSAGLGGGARVGGGTGARGLAAAELRAQYLHTAGLAVGATYTPDAPRTAAGWVAVELRPLFLIAIFENQFVGDAIVDWIRDALGLEAGITWDGASPAFLLGLGTEVPLVRSRDHGLFLRLGGRMLLARSGWVGGAPEATTFELGAALQAHGAVAAGLL